jgi:hypothetical protein
MPYADEAQYRTALEAYLALHEVFYRFYGSVRAQHSVLGDRNAALPFDREATAANERDHARMSADLVPALARACGNMDSYVERLARTLDEIGATHAAFPLRPFDARLADQAYVDIDNVLHDLLRHREIYPRAFDEVYSGAPPQALTRRPPL